MIREYIRKQQVPGTILLHFTMILVVLLLTGAPTRGRTATVTLAEALDTVGLPVTWQTGGLAVWFGQTDEYEYGGDAAQSGPISDGSNTWLEATFTGPIRLTFSCKVSSEIGKDILHLQVDGTTLDILSGDMNWQRRSLLIPKGNHTVRWWYFKDASGSAGRDAAWVDHVEWTATEEWVGNWHLRTVKGRTAHAMAYDSKRGRTVLYGGRTPMLENDTWEWDGSKWSRFYATGPGYRTDHAMAYDGFSGNVVLFGGVGLGSPMQDTWTWDGSVWTLVATTGPSARKMHALVYDGSRERVILFGGIDGSGNYLGDTWEWNGKTWKEVATSGPEERVGHALAYDKSHSQTVLYGGHRIVDSVGEYFGDTWVWDGTSWTEKEVSGPPARRDAHMAFDTSRKRVVLFGGNQSGIRKGDTWEWNGTAWADVEGTGPDAREDAALVFSEKQKGLVLFGGYSTSPATTYWGDTWQRSGTTWSQKSGQAPSARDNHVMAGDDNSGVVILCGGKDAAANRLSDTWAWDNTTWHVLIPQGSGTFSNREGHAMVYDSGRDRMVLFGGGYRGIGIFLEGTQEWNGAAWSKVAESGPPACMDHAMAYDPVRQRTVLFGGFSMSGRRDDTWEWDGTTWTQAATTGPSARRYHAMAFDAVTNRVLLFGGEDIFSNILSDTWAWDGTEWTRVATTGPAGRIQHAMSTNTARKRIVLFGGYSYAGGDEIRTDTWEWNGTEWVQIGTPITPQGRYEHALGYNAAGENLVLFGGRADMGTTLLADTWEYILVESPPLPTPSPTPTPSATPTASPSPSPSESPTETPTETPTPSPTESPSPSPTESPTETPMPSPTESPSPLPTESPTPLASPAVWIAQ